MKGKITAILATLLSFAACDCMSAMEQGIVSGGGLGAGGGALIGAAADSASIGPAIGGNAGLLAAYAYDQYQKPQQADSRPRETSDSKKPRPGKRPDGGAPKKIPEKVPPQEISPATLHVM